MTLKFKIEYLTAIRKRYFQARKREKSQILNELCAVTGFNRKYAIRILAIKHHEGKKQSGRTKTYSERSIRHLKRLWVIMGEMCSKKMVQALKTWLKYYEDDDCDEKIREELLSMGHASIDRYLKTYKASLGRKKRTGTRPGKMFKNVIPLKSFDANDETLSAIMDIQFKLPFPVLSFNTDNGTEFFKSFFIFVFFRKG